MIRIRTKVVRPLIGVVAAGLIAMPAALSLRAQSPARGGALRIVVVEGEGAVNVIQQRTAVAPVVEVRDRNDQPVAGAIVLFSIGSRSKFANGQQTVTVTSDASGRASAGQVVAGQTGSAPIQVRAQYQGQTVRASIRQLNVLTEQQAAAIVASGGAPAAGSGGLSPLAIGAIVGGGAAGAVVGVLAASGEDPPATNAFTVPLTVTGPFSTTEVFVVTPPGCAVTVTNSGTVSITIQTRTATSVSGVGSFVRTLANASPPSCGGFSPILGSQTQTTLGPFSGPPDNVQMSVTGGGNNGISAGTSTAAFSGRLEGSEMTGTLTTSNTTTFLSSGVQVTSTTNVPVVLR